MTDSPSENSLAVRLNRLTLNMSRHWLRYLLFLVGIYVGLPFAAPVLMKVGLTNQAYWIYDSYSLVCHQFGFRSWFLFGEQPAYPRAVANVPNLQSWESFASDIQGPNPTYDITQWSYDLGIGARTFYGDPTMGYKLAFCERDVAIYGGFLLGGLFFSIPYVRRRLRPIPLWLYVVFGILPIAIDGVSQLVSEPPLMFWIQRESTPAFRTLTGLLFGLANAWLAFPYLEASARETLMEIQAKFRARQERLTRTAEA